MSTQPDLVDVPVEKTQVARPLIRVGGDDFEVIATGDVARRFNLILAGTRVTVLAYLVGHQWKVAGGEDHQRLEIKATEVWEV